MIPTPSQPLSPPPVRADSTRPAGPDTGAASDSRVAFAATLDQQVKRSEKSAAPAETTQPVSMTRSPASSEAASPKSMATAAASLEAVSLLVAGDDQLVRESPDAEEPGDASSALAEIAMVMMAGQHLQQAAEPPTRSAADAEAKINLIGSPAMKLPAGEAGVMANSAASSLKAVSLLVEGDDQPVRESPDAEEPQDVSSALAEIGMVMMAGQHLQQATEPPTRSAADEEAKINLMGAPVMKLPTGEAGVMANSDPHSSAGTPPYGQPEPSKPNPLAAGASFLPEQSGQDSAASSVKVPPMPSSSMPVLPTEAGFEFREVAAQTMPPSSMSDLPTEAGFELSEVAAQTMPPSSMPDLPTGAGFELSEVAAQNPIAVPSPKVSVSPSAPNGFPESGRLAMQRSGDVVVGGPDMPPRHVSIAGARTTAVQTNAHLSDESQLNVFNLATSRSAFASTETPFETSEGGASPIGAKPVAEPGEALKPLAEVLGFRLDEPDVSTSNRLAADAVADVEMTSGLDVAGEVDPGISAMAPPVPNPITLEPRSGEPAKPAFSLPTPVGHEAWPKDLGETLVGLNRANLETAELKLNPNHLGPLNVRVRLDEDGSVAVDFTSAHAPVREAIQAASAQLRDMLATQDIRLGELSISTPPAGLGADASSSQFSAFEQPASRQGPSQPASLQGDRGLSPDEGGDDGAVDRRKANASGALSLYA